ncbi:MAG: hypothetical protein J3Q66DRAFT_308698, partial [Benniella sp.]
SHSLSFFSTPLNSFSSSLQSLLLSFKLFFCQVLGSTHGQQKVLDHLSWSTGLFCTDDGRVYCRCATNPLLELSVELVLPPHPHPHHPYGD